MATRGSSKWRSEEWGQACQVSFEKVELYPNGPKISVNRLAADAFEQLGAVFLLYGYVIRRHGIYNCRRITGGTSHSSHAWAISIDVNDDTNPYRRDRLVTDMPYAMIKAIYGIKTVDGIQVWRWGGDWDGRPDTPNSNYDAMHFEIIATPEELAVGFPAVVAKPAVACETAPVLRYPAIKQGARGPAVTELQRRLGMQRLGGGEGIFGPRTHDTVLAYQRSRGLKADGLVGPATWQSLLTLQPPLPVGQPRPQRLAA